VKPEPAPQPEPAKITKTTPQAVAADSAPAVKGNASRSVTHLAENTSAAPVASEPKPIKVVAAPKPDVKVSPAPTPVKHSAPSLSDQAVRMASASAETDLRKADLRPLVAASASADTPVVVPAPKASGTHSTSAARLPAARSTLMSAPALAKDAQAAAPKVTLAPKPVIVASAKIDTPKHIVAPAVPKASTPAHVSVAPKSSGPVKMAMASRLPVSHGTKLAAASVDTASASPTIVDQPKNSSVKNLPISHSAAVKTATIAGGSVSKPVAAVPKAAAPSVAPKITKSTLNKVRVAMAPDFRTAADGVHGRSAFSRPPVTIKPAKAKLEKTTVPAKGKVKVRSFFHDMGGILFWDPSTHTVTACVSGMMIEMQIGSKLAKVNGHQFAMETAPYILDGRTFFEARTYTQACNLLESLQTVGKAEIN